MDVIHRYGMNGGAMCGAGPDKFGRLRISTSGVPSTITCPDCKPTAPMSREAILTALRRAARR